jgi:hypothetical protein
MSQGRRTAKPLDNRLGERLMSLIKLLVKLIADTFSHFFDKPLEAPTQQESRLAEKFKSRIVASQEGFLNQEHLTELWQTNVAAVRNNLMARDPREFLRWEEYMPLLTGQGVLPQFIKLRFSKTWTNRWEKVLKDTHIGHPKPFFLYPKVGCNIILHAHHLEKIEAFLNQQVEDLDVIIEFGCGYGGMCRLIRQLGFSGLYILYDLPQQSILQSYFLESLNLPVSSFEDFKCGKSAENILISEYEQLVDFMERYSKEDTKVSLFIATWSLSECPVDFREKVTQIIFPKVDHLLVAYQESFEGINNVNYFNHLKEKYKDKFDILVEPMFLRKGDYYFLGKKSNNNK